MLYWLLEVLDTNRFPKKLVISTVLLLPPAKLKTRRSSEKPPSFTSGRDKVVTLMYQSNRSINIPPGNPPRAFEFLETLCSNSPLPRPKSCSNAPLEVHCSWSNAPPQETFQELLLCSGSCVCKHGMNGSWIPSNTEQSLCKPLLFSQSATKKSGIFRFKCIKACTAMIYHATSNLRDS